jgi:multiple sugar transport system substrate-binding protein
MPSFQETTNKYTEFFTKVLNEPEIDMDAEIAQLKEDLQKIFDAAK